MARTWECLKYEQRKLIERLRSKSMRPADIADVLGVHLATVYRELKRGTERNTGAYSADLAEADLQAAYHRRGRKKVEHEEPV